MLIRTWGTIEKCPGEKAKIQIERGFPQLRLRDWPELRQGEQMWVLQLAHKKLDDPRVYRVYFLVEFERDEPISMPKRFAIYRTQYYL
jgi:hypothetical protein